VAWVLTRYRFPGRRVLDAMIFFFTRPAIRVPTAVAGIATDGPYARNGWLGGPLNALGVQVAFAVPGIVIALIFVGLPFVVRTVQPVLENWSRSSRGRRQPGRHAPPTLARVVLPAILTAVITGYTLSFAARPGEYGSVVFIAGNMPMKTEIAPLLIVTKLEQYDYAGANAIAVTMLIISFTILLLVNLLQRWSSKRAGQN
jgi:sulfate transport system permease protein